LTERARTALSEHWEITMFRKLSLVAVAVASLGAALLPTSASARWYGGWHHGWWGGPRIVVGGPAYYGYPAYAYGGCYVRRLVPTPWGWRWRLVNRCY
jgi:hypothetical protein